MQGAQDDRNYSSLNNNDRFGDRILSKLKNENKVCMQGLGAGKTLNRLGLR
jgi:tRNA A37 threonylcarbamoyladenosine biosynthesis protein TsaE